MTKVRNLRIDPPAQCNLNKVVARVEIAQGRGVTMA